MAKRFLIACGILAFLAVALGAFGSHMLRGRISPELLRVYETAVHYHLTHALALGILALAAEPFGRNAWLLWSARTMLLGICLFSGSLYLLVFTSIPWLGAITPIGGVSLLLAWILLVLGLLRSPER